MTGKATLSNVVHNTIGIWFLFKKNLSRIQECTATLIIPTKTISAKVSGVGSEFNQKAD